MYFCLSFKLEVRYWPLYLYSQDPNPPGMFIYFYFICVHYNNSDSLITEIHLDVWLFYCFFVTNEGRLNGILLRILEIQFVGIEYELVNATRFIILIYKMGLFVDLTLFFSILSSRNSKVAWKLCAHICITAYGFGCQKIH
jgi:hypothetical protein